MDEQKRLDRIRELFIKLHSGYKWMMDNEEKVEQIEALIERSAPIIEELEKLGVEKNFSQALLLLGGVPNEECVKQFKKEPALNPPAPGSR